MGSSRSSRYFQKYAYNSHTTDFFKKFNILKCKDKYIIQALCKLRTYITGGLPTIYSDIFIYHPEKNRRKHFFSIPDLPHKMRNFPAIALPKIWNSAKIIDIDKSKRKFKNSLKTSLIKSYIEPCKKGKNKCFPCAQLARNPLIYPI